LGDYQVHATLKGSEDDYDAPQARATVRVSRYELPTFTVKADPDRKYYLPGEDATITISADYLFGKPVRNANVRLVNQQNRHWDFKEQKWVTEESNPIEGTFDKEGRFEAKVDLQDEFKDFNPEDYSHYEDLEDLTFAAYVTDLSTKRTEQRRFRIRLTERPIQLYVTSGDSWSAPDKHPSLYVTSSCADGTPASVSGTLCFAEPNNAGEFEKAPWRPSGRRWLSPGAHQFLVRCVARANPIGPTRLLVVFFLRSRRCSYRRKATEPFVAVNVPVSHWPVLR